ncbi:hypothetical protein NBRC116598_33160 [Pseudophaeobacter arcticus]|uniref:Uncharacterized protein n=1 Tax=Pseudophaeobacter arcticus TaxID=385492 RepID=A0ABQ0APQ4_9RHOB
MIVHFEFEVVELAARVSTPQKHRPEKQNVGFVEVRMDRNTCIGAVRGMLAGTAR